jgi:hypothetical protein
MLLKQANQPTTTNQTGEKRRSSLLSANLSRQTFIALVVLEALILCAVGYFFFIKGVVKELKLAEADFISKKSIFDSFKLREDTLVKTDHLYNSLSKDILEKTDLAIPNSPRLPDLLINFDTLIKNNGFSLQKIEFQVVDKKGQEIFSTQKNLAASGVAQVGAELATTNISEDQTIAPKELKTININLGVTGSSYLGLKNLITQLENNLRLVDVISFDFSSTATSFTISVRAYYL